MKAEILKKLRTDAGLTQKELAKELNMSPSMISHYECGRKQPLVETECIIADYFDVTLEYLNGRSKYQKLEDALNSDYTEAEQLKNLIIKMISLNEDNRSIVSRIIHALSTDQDFSAEKPAHRRIKNDRKT